MGGRISIAFILIASLAFLQAGVGPKALASDTKVGPVLSDVTVKGFVHPESVAYEPKEKVLYVSQFGSVLKPLLKDGKGKISKVSLKGVVLEEQCLPAPGGVLNKPKGIWIEGDRLWVTDIDEVWVFDLKTKKGRKVALKGAKFANDPTVMGNVLYVSDTGTAKVYKIEPADFLSTRDPKVTDFVSGLPFAPNGLYPSRDKSLLVVGFMFKGPDKGIYRIHQDGKVQTLVEGIGKLDGIYEPTGQEGIFITDWKSGCLSFWTPKKKAKAECLAGKFGGPADFCAIPRDKELFVVVPDLVKSALRLIRIKM
jgi:hypothetical protein